MLVNNRVALALLGCVPRRCPADVVMILGDDLRCDPGIWIVLLSFYIEAKCSSSSSRRTSFSLKQSTQK